MAKEEFTRRDAVHLATKKQNDRILAILDSVIAEYKYRVEVTEKHEDDDLKNVYTEFVDKLEGIKYSRG